jgi:hypothetical protein
MVITDYCGTKKEQKAMHLCGFLKLNVTTKKDLYPPPFIEEVLDMVVPHEMYYVFNGFLGLSMLKGTGVTKVALLGKDRLMFYQTHGECWVD